MGDPVIRRPRAAATIALLALLGPVVGCGGGGADGGAAGAAGAAAGAEGGAAGAVAGAADTAGGSAAATPVSAAPAERATLDVTVAAPGRTEALKEARVRSPFPSRLVSMRVTDGDRVASGQVVAQVVSKNSEAALRGAESMLSGARTAADSADARRAIEIARQNLVVQPLHSPAAGVVLSHAAAEGDYVDEGEVLLNIAVAGAVFFDAQVSQSDVARVRPGQRASIDVPAVGPAPVTAVVHGILPSASSADLSAPVRLDFSPARPDLTVGLFGTATITVAQRRDVVVVPETAVLTNDVDGTTRMAVIGDDGRAHWLDVRTGVHEDGRVEIVSPRVAPGTRVITQGQVGLPEGTSVQVRR